MHKLFPVVVALAMLATAHSALACLNDSITDLAEGYLTRTYRELRLKRNAVTPMDITLSAAGALLLAGGTARLLRPVRAGKVAPARWEQSPQTAAPRLIQTSGTRSTGPDEIASRNSRSS